MSCIQNLDRLLKKLKNIEQNTDRVVEKGLLKVGEEVRGAAVLLCPVDTGMLRNSIKTEKKAPLAVTVSANMEYAVFVEFGTGTKGDREVPHTKKTSWRWQGENGEWHTSHGQEPQPFMRPAAESVRDKADEIVAAEIRKVIENAGH